MRLMSYMLHHAREAVRHSSPQLLATVIKYSVLREMGRLRKDG